MEHLTPKEFRRQSKPDYPAMLLERLNAAGCTGWQREVQFAWELGRDWRADLLIVTRWTDPSWRLEKAGTYTRLLGSHHVSRGLIVEVDGGVFAGKPCPLCKQPKGGGHNKGAGFRADCEKAAVAGQLGFAVLKVMPDHIKNGNALTWVLAAYRKQVQLI